MIFSKLKVTKLLIDKYRMHNLYAIFAKLLNICKQIAGNLVNESGNVPRRGVVPRFSDIGIVALNMTSEAVGIDSGSLLFAKLQKYKIEIPNLIKSEYVLFLFRGDYSEIRIKRLILSLTILMYVRFILSFKKLWSISLSVSSGIVYQIFQSQDDMDGLSLPLCHFSQY